MTGPSTDGSIDWCFDTPRLHGRLVDERDRDVYRALYTDPAMMAHIGPALARDAADALHAKVCGWNRETPMRARYWRMSLRDTDEVPLASRQTAEQLPAVANGTNPRGQ